MTNRSNHARTVALAAITSAAISVLLGWWQWSLYIPVAKPSNPPGATELNKFTVLTQKDHNSQVNQPARLVGRLLPEHTVLLSDRRMDGKLGYYVLMPLSLDGSSGLSIVVQRGWISSDLKNPVQRAIDATAKHSVIIYGRLAPPPMKKPDLAMSETGQIRKNFDLNQFATQTGLQLMPLTLWEMTDSSWSNEAALNDFYMRYWSEFFPPVHQHYRYALIWFGLAAVLLIFVVWTQFFRQRFAKLKMPPK